MDNVIDGTKLLIQLATDFDNFLEEESDKLGCDKNELQLLIKQLLT